MKKAFSDDPRVMRERVAFAQEAIHWTRERLNVQMFSDEVWAKGGAHTVEWVTEKDDGSERHHLDCVEHKYSKQKAWMFWETLIGRHKGLFLFWEKRWHNMNSASYCEHVMPIVEDYIRAHPGTIYQQDNAPSHRSLETKEWLLDHHIHWIAWPAYSPDLNLIEHV